MLLAKEYLNKHIKHRESLELPRERVFDHGDPSDFQWLKETFRQLSQETQGTLKTNYETATILHIAETITNFEAPLLIADKSIALSKEMNKATLPLRDLKKRISGDINAIDSLLKSDLIAEPTKAILQEQKKSHEVLKNRFVEAETDEVGLAMLYDLFLDPFGSLSYFFRFDDEQWFDKYVEALLLLVLKQHKGRPYKIFWKALQIIIFELLISIRPKTIAPYVQWAKELTATIINESYGRWRGPAPSYPEGTSGYSATLIYKNYGRWSLPILSAKDVDNAVHSPDLSNS
jgi:hypothetical protein